MKLRLDLSGRTFYRLTARSLNGKNKHGQSMWFCSCSCGKETVVMVGKLTSGCTKSCGCLKASSTRTKETNTRHGATVDNRSKVPGAYRSWSSMRWRCLNKKATSYSLYGGRGITICARWLESYEAFLEDMRERPKGTTLDRIDPDGNYEPSNCRWADAKTQANNTRHRRQFRDATSKAA